MASQPQSGAPPLSSSFLQAAREWMREDYASIVVREALDARDQVPEESRQALDAAIRNSGIKVPGGFRPQVVHRAPSHHLQAPLLHKMADSNELTEIILRVWAGAKAELYKIVASFLEENDEPIYGPDRKAGRFRGIWSVKEWEANRDRLSLEWDEFDQDDLGLMLWYVSGKIPIPASATEGPQVMVDFSEWLRLLHLLPADAEQWEQVQEFSNSMAELAVVKANQRVQMAVSILKAKITILREQFSSELTYLERDMDLWAYPIYDSILPADALSMLDQVAYLESLLIQYRPIRDRALVRSEEYARASRRAELEREMIEALNRLERLLSGGRGLKDESDESISLAPATNAAVEDVGAGLAPPPTSLGSNPENNPSIPAAATPTEAAPRASEPTASLEPTAPSTQPAVPAQTQGPERTTEAAPRASEPTSSLEPTAPPTQPGVPAQAGEQNLPVGLQDKQEETDVGEEDREDSPADYQDLRIEYDRLISENNHLKGELYSQKDREEYWRQAYITTSSKGAEATEESASPQDVNEAIEQAKSQFPNELLFRLNSKSWVKNNPYEDPPSVLDALKWLATTYYRSRTGDITVQDLDTSIYEVCRWKYVSNQSSVTMGKYESDYKAVAEDKTYWLGEHIGRGNSKNAFNSIRIAFSWDKEQKRVIIGYIGQHQQTDAT